VTCLEGGGRVRYTVCTLEGGGPIEGSLRAAGVEIIGLGSSTGLVRQVFGGALRIRRLLKTGRFDLIHSFLYRSHCASRLARFGMRRRIPLVSSERCLGDNRGGAVRRLNRWTSRFSDRIVAVSQAVGGRAVERDRVPRGRVVVVPNGIEVRTPDPRIRRRLRHALRLADAHVLMLYLGRLHREKGPDRLLDALARLRARSGGAWSVALIGGGTEDERALIDRMTVTLGLKGRVLLAGPRRRVDPWIDACDILVLPSREEGMPVAALEAMMHARPVVATRVGGTPEVVRDGETGLLVPSEDPESLSLALERLVQDAPLRRKLGEAGRARALAEFTIERMAGGTLDVYRRVLEERIHVATAAAVAGRD
jgi:glycosyltransferase involved in cell wall biosynthesis